AKHKPAATDVPVDPAVHRVSAKGASCRWLLRRRCRFPQPAFGWPDRLEPVQKPNNEAGHHHKADAKTDEDSLPDIFGVRREVVGKRFEAKIPNPVDALEGRSKDSADRQNDT